MKMRFLKRELKMMVPEVLALIEPGDTVQLVTGNQEAALYVKMLRNGGEATIWFADDGSRPVEPETNYQYVAASDCRELAEFFGKLACDLEINQHEMEKANG